MRQRVVVQVRLHVVQTVPERRDPRARAPRARPRSRGAPSNPRASSTPNRVVPVRVASPRAPRAASDASAHPASSFAPFARARFIARGFGAHRARSLAPRSSRRRVATVGCWRALEVPRTARFTTGRSDPRIQALKTPDDAATRERVGDARAAADSRARRVATVARRRDAARIRASRRASRSTRRERGSTRSDARALRNARA